MTDEFRSSLRQTAGAVAAAALFGCALWRARGRGAAQEFAAGYLVEQSLSVDNLFVFIMLFERAAGAAAIAAPPRPVGADASRRRLRRESFADADRRDSAAAVSAEGRTRRRRGAAATLA